VVSIPVLQFRVVFGSNLGQSIDYPEGFCGFPQSVQANVGTVS
jgi:hypothetical protein